MLSEACTPIGGTDAGNSDLTYAWSTGETSASITVNESGTYEVTVTDCKGCTAIDQVEVRIERPQAGTVSATQMNVSIENGRARLEASANGDAAVPAGYEQAYVLTRGEELFILETGVTPTFVVTAAGKFTIHSLVFDPATLDLSIVVPGQTTGFDVNNLLIQGGGSICGLSLIHI